MIEIGRVLIAGGPHGDFAVVLDRAELEASRAEWPGVPTLGPGEIAELTRIGADAAAIALLAKRALSSAEGEARIIPPATPWADLFPARLDSTADTVRYRFASVA